MGEAKEAGTAIVAALPREVAALVKGAAADPEQRKKGIFVYRIPGAVVVAGGMGDARAALGVEAALSYGGVRRLISVGLAGSCSAAVRPGDVVEAGVVVDARTGERFATDAGSERAVLVTAGAIASVREKARLAEAYDAAMVDMEAATVARLARAHGVGFRAVKGISDGYAFELGGLARFQGRQGSFRTGAFALYTALRPGTWRRAMELGGGSKRALAALDARLRSLLAEQE